MLIVLLFSLSSCNTSKYLSDSQTFLAENTIEIESNDDIIDKVKLKKNLNNQIIQRPNGKILFSIPKEYIYYRNSESGDTSWYNNFLRKSLGEPPSIFSENMTKETAQKMQNYLVNKKGYYNAFVDYQLNTTPPITTVQYNVNTGNRYKINSIQYIGKDKKVLSIIKSIKNDAIIKAGDPIDASSFDKELTRLSLALQNRGYANFATNYFNIKGDSALNQSAVDIFLELRPPLPDSFHHQYTIGKINIYSDFHRTQQIDKLDSMTYMSNVYYKQADHYLVKPSTIARSVFMNKGKLYNRNDRSKTRKKLAELGTYRFVTMNAQIDKDIDTLINYNIFLTPYNNKWVADYGSDLFFSTIRQSNRQLFGFSLNSQFKNRNLFGGAEQFTIGSESALELQVQPNVEVRTISIGLNSSLEIPKHIDLFRITSALNSINLISDKFYSSFQENTTTNINSGYNFINILDSYRRSSFNASYGYNFKPSQNKRWIIRQVGMEYNDYKLTEDFVSIIGNNPLLLRSFEDNLQTGFLFRDIRYIYTGPISKKNTSFTFISGFEMSGWETYLLNQGYNKVFGKDKTWKFSKQIGFSKYIKANIEPRFYKHFSKKHSLALRAFAGIIIPFGGDKVSPFFKQFSAGGPNSLRGWAQKELGPGSYGALLESPIEGQTFYQTGDIKLEFNVEYRFDLFWYVEGALFVDAGNVWTLREHENRPGSKFGNNFLDEFAINTGYGIRFDFDYFNIRFDFGYRIRNPYKSEVTLRQWYNWKEFKAQGFGNFQVAVNYPF
ncbi:MAG: BamA/TamA family outer membrane protein [Saprospiraceae bacterium]